MDAIKRPPWTLCQMAYMVKGQMLHTASMTVSGNCNVRVMSLLS
jgi:hypothetical protein